MQTIINKASSYLINKNGDVFSKKTNRILKGYISVRGYLVYGIIGDDKKMRIRPAHRLIAETFITPILGKTHVNHKDGNKLNNSIENLEWCTNIENLKHSHYVLGNPGFKKGEEHICAKLNPRKVRAIRKSYIDKKTTQRKLAKKYKVSNLVIHHVLHRKTWKSVI